MKREVKRQLMTSHLYFIGVHPGTFWLANLTWDILLLLVSASLAVIFMVAFDSQSLFTTNGAGGI